MQETHHIREHGNIINQQPTLSMRSHVYCCVVRGSSWSAGRGFAWSLCRKSAIEITKPLSLNASFDRVGTRQAILRMWRGKICRKAINVHCNSEQLPDLDSRQIIRLISLCARWWQRVLLQNCVLLQSWLWKKQPEMPLQSILHDKRCNVIFNGF